MPGPFIPELEKDGRRHVALAYHFSKRYPTEQGKHPEMQQAFFSLDKYDPKIVMFLAQQVGRLVLASLNNFVITCVPPNEMRMTNKPVAGVMRQVARLTHNNYQIHLKRVQSLPFFGDISTDYGQHWNSLEVVNPAGLQGKMVLLVNDIDTTEIALKASRDRLVAAGVPEERIYTLSLAKNYSQRPFPSVLPRYKVLYPQTHANGQMFATELRAQFPKPVVAPAPAPVPAAPSPIAAAPATPTAQPMAGPATAHTLPPKLEPTKKVGIHKRASLPISKGFTVSLDRWITRTPKTSSSETTSQGSSSSGASTMPLTNASLPLATSSEGLAGQGSASTVVTSPFFDNANKSLPLTPTKQEKVNSTYSVIKSPLRSISPRKLMFSPEGRALSVLSDATNSDHRVMYGLNDFKGKKRGYYEDTGPGAQEQVAPSLDLSEAVSAAKHARSARS